MESARNSGSGSGSGGRQNDPEPDEPMTLARAAAANGPNAPSKETPISNYPSLTYGFQETHTTILPWTGYVTAAGLDVSTQVQLKIRCNAPVDMLPITVASGTAAGTQLIKGLHPGPATELGTASYYGYPGGGLGSGDTTTERPAFCDPWFRMYQYYTVLACHYEITVMNVNERREYMVALGVQYDSHTGAVRFVSDHSDHRSSRC